MFGPYFSSFLLAKVYKRKDGSGRHHAEMHRNTTCFLPDLTLFDHPAGVRTQKTLYAGDENRHAH
jgi:hypothetical protein